MGSQKNEGNVLKYKTKDELISKLRDKYRHTIFHNLSFFLMEIFPHISRVPISYSVADSWKNTLEAHVLFNYNDKPFETTLRTTFKIIKSSNTSYVEKKNSCIYRFVDTEFHIGLSFRLASSTSRGLFGVYGSYCFNLRSYVASHNPVNNYALVVVPEPSAYHVMRKPIIIFGFDLPAGIFRDLITDVRPV